MTRADRFLRQAHRYLALVSVAALWTALLWPALPATGQETPSAETLRRQATQEGVRRMAKDLVAGLLDRQLQQLEENGLTDLEIYGEIRLMRQQLDELVDRHMPEVVELLGQISEVEGPQREAVFREAREKSRTILVRLLAERQRLLRRLRIAELEARVRRLIDEQTQVHTATAELPELPAVDRAARAVSVLEDQQDVSVLYEEMNAALADVADWGGAVARDAEQAQAALREARTDELLADAIAQLEAARFEIAGEHQRRIVAALNDLLKRIHRVQGVAEEEDRRAAQEAIEQLAARQEELRQRTTAPDVAAEQLEALTEEQMELRGQIRELAEQLPAAETPLRAAEQAAAEAASDLFEGDPQAAAEDQAEVNRQLADAGKQLAQAPSQTETAELRPAEREADLATVKASLEEIRREQQDVSQRAATEPETARSGEEEIGRQLSEVAEQAGLPDEVEQAAQHAAEAAQSAAAQMASDESTRREATRRAEQAIDEALSATAKALADQQRRQLARQIAQTAQQARQSQHQAARRAELRRARQLSEELSQLARQQRSQAARAREAVERAIAERPEPITRELERLDQAARRVVEAAAQQQRALGRPRAAEAIEQAPDLATAAQLARQAAQAELASAEHPPEAPPATGTPSATETGEGPDSPAQQPQESASGATGEEPPGAHDLHGASQNEAPSSRQGAQPGNDDAQRAVSQAIAQAREFLEADSPAGEALRRAAQSSGRAEASLAEGAFPEAHSEQLATAEHLADAAAEVAEALSQAGRRGADQLAQDAQQSVPLAEQAIPVEPEATGSLHVTENTARRGAQTPNKNPAPIAQAEQKVAQAMAAAAASLAAREQELAQVESLASRIPELLARQQPLDQPPESTAGGESSETPSAGGELSELQVILEQLASAMPSSGMTPGQAPPNSPSGQPPTPGSQQASQTTAQSQQASATSQPSQGRTPEGDSRTGDAAQLADEVTAGDSAQSWLMALPPSTRAAIRAGMQQPPPPGYEERLRRYFRQVEP